MEKVAVVGASGMLGKPVVEALLKAGFKVRVIGRDKIKLTELFGDRVEYGIADVGDKATLEPALSGCDGVHINLAGFTPESCQKVQVEGSRNIAQVAKSLGLRRITYLSGTTSFDKNSWHYDTKAKLDAEKAIKDSGVPYLIFCPSWFVDTLPQFIQDGRGVVFGKTTQPIRWLTAVDYAAMVANSYTKPELENKRLYIHGPEKIDMFTALKTFCDLSMPEVKVYRLPYWVGNLLAQLTKDDVLKDAVALLDYYEKVGEEGDTSEADQLLGKPQMTLSQWSAGQ